MKSRCEHNHITRVRCGSRDGLSCLRAIPACANRTELILPAGAATASWFCFAWLFGLMLITSFSLRFCLQLRHTQTPYLAVRTPNRGLSPAPAPCLSPLWVFPGEIPLLCAWDTLPAQSQPVYPAGALDSKQPTGAGTLGLMRKGMEGTGVVSGGNRQGHVLIPAAEPRAETCAEPWRESWQTVSAALASGPGCWKYSCCHQGTPVLSLGSVPTCESQVSPHLLETELCHLSHGSWGHLLRQVLR